MSAWTQHGNALRLTGRYAEAESLLARAAALPVSDLPTSIHLLEVRSSLDRNTGRYESAERFLADALAAHESLADPVGLARIYNLLGLAYSESGDRSRALRAFQTAFSFLGQGAPLDILATTGHNLFHTFVAAGRLDAAEAALASLEPFYSRLTSPRLAAKAAWMRARLFRRLRRLLAARRAYDRAYELCAPRNPRPSWLSWSRRWPMSRSCSAPSISSALPSGVSGLPMRWWNCLNLSAPSKAGSSRAGSRGWTARRYRRRRRTPRA